MNTRNNFIHGAWRVLLALVFSLSLAGVSAQGARAASLTVVNLSDSGKGSLRQAIISANAIAGRDEITFSVNGTINLESSLPAVTDDLSLSGDGKYVTINGDNLYRVLSIGSGTFLYIDTLSIINGHHAYGGGFFNDGGVLTIVNCVIADNSAARGGGIYNNYGTVSVVSSIIGFNKASNIGAGIFNAHGTLGVHLSLVNQNNANGFSSFGGGIFNAEGTVSVTSSTFSGNTASSGGGGIVNVGEMKIANSTFFANSSPDYGGGVYNSEGTLTLINNTFSGNGAAIGAGVFSVLGTTLYYYNNILANSIDGEDCYSDVVPAGNANNLVESYHGCGTPISSADPKLGPLSANGGPTKTMGLKVGSPAIDSGNDVMCADIQINNKDQRGITRPSGAHCDIGSYEASYFRSAGAYDGWILEYGEDSTTGGTLNATAITFNLGDNGADKQYRAILSFNTAGLPNNAIISKVTLSIKTQPQMGSDPFAILGGLKVDIRKPFFGSAVGLNIGDFQAAAGRSGAGTFGITPVDGWYSAVIGSTAFPFINLSGATQFRLRFYIGDNDDMGADYMRFYSGNYAAAIARPTLIIDYDVPYGFDYKDYELLMER